MLVRCKCTICAEEFARTDMTALLCGHVFHAKCIQSWFEKRTTTPTCPCCGTSTDKNLIVRRLFFNACDDQDDDGLMEIFEKTKFALLRAKEEIQELKNDKKEVDDKLALERGKVSSLEAQNSSQNGKLNEAKNTQEELLELIRRRGEELKDREEYESDLRSCIQIMEEQLRYSKKNEDDSNLLVKSLEEQLRTLKKNQNDSKLLIKDSNLHIENMEQQLRTSNENEHLIGNVGQDVVCEDLFLHQGFSD
ncbi:unnamed protein product [Cylicocyclus nassatus]|uniref:RING-type domain-containing protein n=1 Tax=Cylicocyclus nassatus TaxID=53992 RepID=A0AA36GPS6_CYLNA|nr:unnamed protein product [Cylicocyclus nassatus]